MAVWIFLIKMVDDIYRDNERFCLQAGLRNCLAPRPDADEPHYEVCQQALPLADGDEWLTYRGMRCLCYG